MPFALFTTKPAANITVFVTPTELPTGSNDWLVYAGNICALMIPNSVLEAIQLLLVISVFVLYYYALELGSQEDSKSRYDDETRALQFRQAWRVDHWPTLFALTEKWIYGDIPWGPWDASSITERWFSEKNAHGASREKGYMRRLCRAGLMPLYIRDGGVKRFQISGFKVDGWNIRLPVYERSDGRAHFDFIMPCPWGMDGTALPNTGMDRARMEFRRLLLVQRQYAVTMSLWSGGLQQHKTPHTSSKYLQAAPEPLEIGARSRCPLLLLVKPEKPLKPTRGLQGPEARLSLTLPEFVYGEGRDVSTNEGVARVLPLLRQQSYAIIRVEALNNERHELDKWVYSMAQRAGMGDIWTEGYLGEALGKVYEECDIPVA